MLLSDIHVTMRKIIIYLFAILLIGCTYEEIPESIELKSEVVNESDSLAEPAWPSISGQFLGVTDAYADPALHIINLENDNYEKGVGTRGEGPGEFTGIFGVKEDLSSTGFWINDAQLRRFTHVNLDNMDNIGEKVIHIDEPGLVLDFSLLEDSTFAVTGRFDSPHRILFLDRTGNIVNSTAEFSAEYEGIPLPELQNAYQSRITRKPNDSLFAVAALYGNRIDVISYEEGIVNTVRSPGINFNPILEDGTLAHRSGDAARHGYNDVTATDQFIIGIFSGVTNTERHNAIYGKYVHVYTWEGELHSILELDRYGIGVAVDDAGNLYTSTAESKPSIIRYDASSILSIE